jgi:hypothetical protein
MLWTKVSGNVVRIGCYVQGLYSKKNACGCYAQGFQGYLFFVDQLWMLSARVLSDCHGFGCHLQGFQSY